MLLKILILDYGVERFLLFWETAKFKNNKKF